MGDNLEPVGKMQVSLVKRCLGGISNSVAQRSGDKNVLNFNIFPRERCKQEMAAPKQTEVNREAFLMPSNERIRAKTSGGICDPFGVRDHGSLTTGHERSEVDALFSDFAFASNADLL
ncbi:hypothetical protein TNIN_353051 [Trichonephila inaurata madagascariensis]|uniref:Uncharacterized protein n=1 Tax=Trichonephila inaurata madagascariensis TaxID=2747483 RepID=A0A8X7CIM0_9ARAC|nr:hypothetical protein TNIN_353051 [Trichonephila inaurata madagascariensis]